MGSVRSVEEAFNYAKARQIKYELDILDANGTYLTAEEIAVILRISAHYAQKLAHKHEWRKYRNEEIGKTVYNGQDVAGYMQLRNVKFK